MRCILGIGNPGKRYLNTRHNIGFQLVDDFATRLNLTFKPSKYDYYFAEGQIEDSAFSIIKPSNYVNNSGVAAYQCLNRYNTGVHDLLVVVDDVIFDSVRSELENQVETVATMDLILLFTI